MQARHKTKTWKSSARRIPICRAKLSLLLQIFRYYNSNIYFLKIWSLSFMHNDWSCFNVIVKKKVAQEIRKGKNERSDSLFFDYFPVCM